MSMRPRIMRVLIWIITLFLMLVAGSCVAVIGTRTPSTDSAYTIQDAINNASPGDRILVPEGVYYENIVVNKSVSIVGESEATTVIDGGGLGTAVKITADNVSLSGFTITNSSEKASESGISIESSYDSVHENLIVNNGLRGVSLNNSFGSLVFNNIVATNGASGIYIYNSINNVFFNNTVSGNSGGIQSYASNNNNFTANAISHDLLGGFYLFYSSHNSLYDNFISDNKNYGLNLDFSSDMNNVSDNVIVNNLGFGVSLSGVTGNFLRRNNMTGNQFNFYVVPARPDLEDYLNDIDPSNTVNGEKIYVVTNEEDLTVDPVSYPNLGYLALINSTKVTVRGLNISDNGQAVLLAFVSNATVEDLYVSDNDQGIQLCSASHVTIRNCTITNNCADGITLDYSPSNNIIGNIITTNALGLRGVHGSDNNTIYGNDVSENDVGIRIYSYCEDNLIMRNVISNNGIAVMLQRVTPTKVIGNLIRENNQGLFLETSDVLAYHNDFVNNTVQAVTPDFQDVWDGGYVNGGNYWSDYHGEDVDGDGIGDVPYVIDENNTDRYPLVSLWTEEDQRAPAIGFPTRFPVGEIQPDEQVTVSVRVSDVGSGVMNVTLYYVTNNGTSWADLNMNYNSTIESFVAVLPGLPAETSVKYEIVAFDKAGNVAVKDNSSLFFTYGVVPEFVSPYLLLSFLAIITIGLLVMKTLKRNTRDGRNFRRKSTINVLQDK
jgi:parallel beta-helix repeat protein